MNCPSCQVSIVHPKFYQGFHDEAIVVEVEDVIYNRERPVIGFTDGNVLTTHNYDTIDNDTVINSIYQCNRCGYELSEADVIKAITEWEV